VEVADEGYLPLTEATDYKEYIQYS
jgi:hypothetical protein